ncbi:MAG: Sec-independent protein translocase subunit TatA [Umezawaea sp.]|uniref:Sec-independent protein translocase subunit TatA n=1 Tax=Umezawaea sp. Da 62-37 TaxID=3075927 RepID=UPI0028F73EC8|nr:Sec-independent protein translocase subunit TatA [Umezawaea sp. Da 62-37]WNV87942.1 Sec-independent protein translocase subunit TatA [Umezawaea sp. Da 62-37]
MGTYSPSHWLVVLLLAVVLFGAKRLPDAARGVGRSLRVFKAELKDGQEESHP